MEGGREGRREGGRVRGLTDFNNLEGGGP